MGSRMVEIVIEGTLGDALLGVIDDFHVDHVAKGRTHLVGPAPDPARLQGVLSQLSSLNIHLISVNPVS